MLLKSPPPSMQMEWEVQQMRREYEAQFPPNPFEHVGEGYEAHAPLPIAHMEVRDPCDDIIGNSFHDDPFGGNPFDNPFSANPFDDPFNYDPFNYVPHPDDDVTDEDNGGKSTRKPRRRNDSPHVFGDVFEANWYRQFLCPEVRDRTYRLSSRDRYGDFRCLFRLPLKKVDDLVNTFLEKDWIRLSKHCRNDEQLRVKAQLLILGTLNVLGHHSPFKTVQ